MMEKYDKWGSLFWLGLGLVIMYGAYGIGLGSLSTPGGGLFIFVLGVLLSLLGCVILISSWGKGVRGSASAASLWAGLKWQNPVYILMGLLLYTLMMTMLGYILATGFLMLFLFGLFERRRWKMVILEAFFAGFGSYLLFGVWLQLRLPRGFLETLIGF